MTLISLELELPLLVSLHSRFAHCYRGFSREKKKTSIKDVRFVCSFLYDFVEGMKHLFVSFENKVELWANLVHIISQNKRSYCNSHNSHCILIWMFSYSEDSFDYLQNKLLPFNFWFDKLIKIKKHFKAMILWLLFP